MTGGDVVDRRNRTITRDTDRKLTELEVNPQHEAPFGIRTPRGYIRTGHDGERKVLYQYMKVPKWRADHTKATSGDGPDFSDEDPQYQEAGNESQNHVEDDGTAFSSQEETLRVTSTWRSTLRTEATRRHVPSKVRSRSSGVSDASRFRPTSQQHIIKGGAGQRYMATGKGQSKAHESILLSCASVREL